MGLDTSHRQVALPAACTRSPPSSPEQPVQNASAGTRIQIKGVVRSLRIVPLFLHPWPWAGSVRGVVAE